MASTRGTLLSGPLALLAGAFGAGWLLLGVLMVVLQAPAGFWFVTAPACVAAAVATLIIGYRSSLRMHDDGLHIPGGGDIVWENIESVRVAQTDGGWAPMLEVADGRALRLVELDGLMARKPEGRVLRQAQAIADRAGRDLEFASPDAANARPSRAL